MTLYSNPFFNIMKDKKGAYTNLIQIAICEDDQILLDQLAHQVREILDRHSFKYRLEQFTSGGALLSRGTFDILLLDIAMKPFDGLELARKLRARGDESKLIFITAYPQYAIKAYDVQAFHYLVKPVNTGKLEELLLKLCSSLQETHQQAIAIRQGTSIRRVPFAQILYLEVLGRKIYLHTLGESVPFYGKLRELAPKLPDLFFQCHRSYLVNLGHVQCYQKGEVQLDNEECIPLSKRRHQAFGLAFLHYLKESGDIF